MSQVFLKRVSVNDLRSIHELFPYDPEKIKKVSVEILRNFEWQDSLSEKFQVIEKNKESVSKAIEGISRVFLETFEELSFDQFRIRLVGHSGDCYITFSAYQNQNRDWTVTRCCC